MPLDNSAFLPPSSRFRTVMTKLGDALSPKVEVVRYFLRLPDEETEDKVVYIEPAIPAVLVNESIDGSQRSVMPFRVRVYGYINESDTRILSDFVHEVMDVLNTAANRTTFKDAFATDDGFTIETITWSESGFGEEFGQFVLTVELMFHHP